MSGVSAWILGDQLSADNPALRGADRVLLVQSRGALGAKAFHRQKLHLILVAMRSFADELRDRGYEVDLRWAQSLGSGVRAHLREHRPERIQVLAPSSASGRALAARLDRVEIVPGSLFLSDTDAFAEWARNRKRLTMEDFYRGHGGGSIC